MKNTTEKGIAKNSNTNRLASYIINEDGNISIFNFKGKTKVVKEKNNPHFAVRFWDNIYSQPLKMIETEFRTSIRKW